MTDKAVQLQPDFLSLLVWKFFCNPSTGPSFLVKHVTITAKSSCENYFQYNLQVRYLHNSIFKSNFVIKRHSVTPLMMLLKFIGKKQDILIYKCAKGIFLHNVCATLYYAKFGTFL